MFMYLFFHSYIYIYSKFSEYKTLKNFFVFRMCSVQWVAFPYFFHCWNW